MFRPSVWVLVCVLGAVGCNGKDAGPSGRKDDEHSGAADSGTPTMSTYPETNAGNGAASTSERADSTGGTLVSGDRGSPSFGTDSGAPESVNTMTPTSTSDSAVQTGTEPEGGETHSDASSGGDTSSRSDGSDAGVGGELQHVDVPPPGTAVTSPPGCSEPIYFPQMNVGDFCAYSIACGDTASIGTTIDPAGIEWHNCSRYGDHFRYRLTGIEGTEACAFGTNFCIAFDGEVTSAEACEVERPIGDDNRCETELRCTRPVDLGSGILAHIDQGASKINCASDGQGRWACGCQDRNGYSRALLVDATSSSQACGALEDACFNGEVLEFSDDRECRDSYPLVWGSYSCSVAQDCTRAAAPAPNGAVPLLNEEDTASCYDEGGAWSCHCTAGDNVAFHFSPVVESAPEVVCVDALDVCRTGLRGTGPIACSSVVDAPGYSDCRRNFTCSQPAESGSLEVSRHSSGSVECTKSASGWDCPCYDGGRHVFHYTDSLQDATAACSAAARDCGARGEL